MGDNFQAASRLMFTQPGVETGSGLLFSNFTTPFSYLYAIKLATLCGGGEGMEEMGKG